MTHLPINHSPVPIRLFKSDFLEFFTHISPLAVTVIWLPVILFLLYRTVYWTGIAGGWQWIFLLGLVLWTPTEYLLHRFVFHFRPRNAWQERLTFLFHGIHHAQPQIKTRLVMPPAVSIPLAALIYGLLHLVLVVWLKAPHWRDGLTSGLLMGYLIYDITHYATHHFPMRGKVLKFLKRYHMQHHYKTPDQRFGVSSPLWDWVFGTLPRQKD